HRVSIARYIPGPQGIEDQNNNVGWPKHHALYLTSLMGVRRGQG
ncbi:MAG: hypothetical protein HW378_1814, partial [Anaerolineales bacterium]|nr:hypothetical protein [Anaerolineales bacterium]